MITFHEIDTNEMYQICSKVEDNILYFLKFILV